MPAATKYNPQDEDLRKEAISERAGRLADANKAEAYYRGDHKKPLRVKPTEPDLNVIVNQFAARIDRRRDFLFPAFPDIELDDDDSEVNDDETWLDQAWEANGDAVLAGEMCLDGCKFGHVYARLLEPNKRIPYPRVRLLNNVITYWKADDVDSALWHEVQWTVGKITFRQDILDLDAMGEGSGYLINEFQQEVNASGKASSWTRMGSERWPYETPPIVDWQHWPKPRVYYGGSEAGDLDLNDALNRVLSQASSVIRNHAFPKTVATGVQAGKVDVATAIDSFWTIQNAQAKVYNLEMQSDLSAITNMANALEKAYTVQGRIVVISGNPADFARLTNLAVRTVFMPMVNANKTLQRQYGNGIKQLSLAMLCMAKRRYDYTPTLEWAESLPENDLEQAQLVQILRGLGLMSKQTGASEVGLDWVTEQERMDDESQGHDDLMQRIVQMGGAQPFALSPGRSAKGEGGMSQAQGGANGNGVVAAAQ